MVTSAPEQLDLVPDKVANLSRTTNKINCNSILSSLYWVSDYLHLYRIV